MINNIYQIDKEKIKDRKIVIFGCGRKARGLAIQMLNEDIYFHGFLIPDDKRNYSRVSLWNKPLLDVSECSGIDSLAIVSQPTERDSARSYLRQYGLEDKYIDVQILHHKLMYAPYIIIYGTKLNAELMLQKVIKYVEVKYFCDSNEEKTGGEFCGRRILGIGELEQIERCEVIPILIASRFYEEIIPELLRRKQEQDNIFMDLDYFQYTDYKIFINTEEESPCIPMPFNDLTSSACLQRLICDSKKYQLILCGSGRRVIAWQKKLQLLSVNTDTFCMGYNSSLTGLITKYKENQLFIMVDEDSRELEQKIEQTGISEKFVHISRYRLFLQYNKINMYADPILGLTYKNISDNTDMEYVTYGYQKEEQDHVYRILVLGNSSSAEVGIRNRQWCWYLSEILRGKDISHQIICCGMICHKVFQELHLLLRDGLAGRKPDLVISYSGSLDFDITVRSYYQFLHPWQRRLFMTIGGALENSRIEWKDIPGYVTFSGVTFGIRKENSSIRDWFETESIMNDICVAKGIKFYGFWQPVLVTKNFWSENERQMALAELEVLRDDKGTMVDSETCTKSRWLEELVLIKNEYKQAEWFNDLSDLFDNSREDVYFDFYHIYPEKNKIVAEKIWETVKKDIS